MKTAITTMIIGAFLILFIGCKKDDDELQSTISTHSVTKITATTATCGGEFQSGVIESVTDKGVCWNTSSTPKISDNRISNGGGSTYFKSNLTGLSPNTRYYIRAYVTKGSSTAYGREITFKTQLTDSAPCTPQKNSIYFNTTITYYTTAGENSLIYGDYGLVGNGMNSDLRIEFPEAPITGRYVTINGSSFIEDGQCVVNGTFGGSFGTHCVAVGGDTVYVIKTGDGLYSMTFCNLNFQSVSSSLTFSSSGNLTTE
jgi:hypothetical protein